MKIKTSSKRKNSFNLKLRLKIDRSRKFDFEKEANTLMKIKKFQ